MLPLVITVIWQGGLLFKVLTVLFTVAMAWEWNRMVKGHFGLSGLVITLVGVCTIFTISYGYTTISLVIIIGSSAMIVSFGTEGKWPAAGILYISLPCIALVWLRETDGPETLLWLFFVVWITDIVAYGAGRCIGGPRLAPSVSPGKTWAGAIGGLLAAMLVGCVIAVLLDLTVPWILVAASAGISIVAQLGDLAESKLKRHFGVKDSGRLIPGHGGVLDRVDGVVAAAPVVAAAVLLVGGGIRLWG